MDDVKTNLYPCKHCGETGICKSGKEESSCFACVKNHELKTNREYVGLACGTCGGLGLAEPVTERMNKRIKPLLAMGIVFLVLIFTFALAAVNNQHFNEFLAFSGTLIGSITAYYFSYVKTTRN